MPTTRADVQAALAVHDPAALRAILEAAGVSPRGAQTARELAKRIGDALWWDFTTPLGYLADRTSLEDIVGHVANKLSVGHVAQGPGDAWAHLRALTVELVREVQAQGVRLEDLDPKTRAFIWPDWMPTMAYGAGASGSFGARWASGHVVRFLKGPIGRLLPLIPPIAPYVGAIRVGAGAVHVVSGPLGLALSVLTFNQALGANYHRLVPLLLGVGALGPKPVDDAEVLDD